MFTINVVETNNTQILCSIFLFSRKSCRLRDNVVKKYGGDGEATDEYTAHVEWMLGN